MYLGLLAFLAMVCEGGMFDWSGIYFQQVIKEEIFTAGYLTFMVFMATSRFISDRIIDKIGMAKAYIMSAVLIFSGHNAWPFFSRVSGRPCSVFRWLVLARLRLFPLTYTLAGTSKTYSPGMAVSLIATFGIVGMLLGPPMIGYLAHAFNLKISFIAFAISGIMLIPISQLFFRLEK